MRVLVIAAHPDDTEYISGGTIHSMVKRGDEVHYIIVTSGELGLPPEEVDLYIRENEQRNAAEVLGVTSVEFFREPDGAVIDSADLRFKLAKSIREFQPEIVISHSPTYHLGSVRYSHSDHLSVGRAAMAAVFPEARNPRFHSSQVASGLQPWAVRELWLCGVEHSNLVMDITDHFAEKLAAVAMHQSQKRHFKDLEAFFREWAQEVAERHGLPTGRLAEEFHQIDSR